ALRAAPVEVADEADVAHDAVRLPQLAVELERRARGRLRAAIRVLGALDARFSELRVRQRQPHIGHREARVPLRGALEIPERVAHAFRGVAREGVTPLEVQLVRFEVARGLLADA